MAGKKGQAPRVEFSQGLFDRICALLAVGGSLREVCAMEDMPDRATFNKWRKLTSELQAQYDAACVDREEVYFGEKRVTKSNGDVEVTEIDMVERARVQIDARKWCLARMNRKKYGDRIEAELTGKDGGPIVVSASPLDERL